MKRNILTPEPGITEVLHSRFPERVLPRGPIIFLGPFSDEETDQARMTIGLIPAKARKGPGHRDGNYYAVVNLRDATRQELLEIFKSFLEEVSLPPEAKP